MKSCLFFLCFFIVQSNVIAQSVTEAQNDVQIINSERPESSRKNTVHISGISATTRDLHALEIYLLNLDEKVLSVEKDASGSQMTIKLSTKISHKDLLEILSERAIIYTQINYLN